MAVHSSTSTTTLRWWSYWCTRLHQHHHPEVVELLVVHSSTSTTTLGVCMAHMEKATKECSGAAPVSGPGGGAGGEESGVARLHLCWPSLSSRASHGPALSTPRPRVLVSDP